MIFFWFFSQRCELRICLRSNKKLWERSKARSERLAVDKSSISISSSIPTDIEAENEIFAPSVAISNEDLIESETVSSSRDQTITSVCSIESLSDLQEPTSLADSLLIGSRKKIFYKCPKCDKTFVKKRCADVHCISKKQPWKCDICGIFINHHSNRNRHRRRCAKKMSIIPATKPVKSYSCEDCDMVCVNATNLKRHRFRQHGVAQRGDLKCDVENCSFSSNHMAQMKRHVTVEHSEKEVECEKCDFSCHSMSGLIKHMLNVHGYQCCVCSKMFDTEEKLSFHSRIHRSEARELRPVIVRIRIDEHQS